MQLHDWNQILRSVKSNDRGWLVSQLKLERTRVKEYATTQGLSYDLAERTLAEQKAILNVPYVEIPTRNWQLQTPDPSSRKVHLDEIMAAGEDALTTFKKTGAHEITFPNGEFNKYAVGDWLRGKTQERSFSALRTNSSNSPRLIGAKYDFGLLALQFGL